MTRLPFSFESRYENSNYSPLPLFDPYMKKLLIPLLCGCALLFSGCATPPAHDSARHHHHAASPYVKLLSITANVDGSGRIIFTRDNVHYEHKNWQLPTHVTFNDQPWTELNQTPAGWREFCDGLDLSRARIVNREGRDVIALERTAAGFDLYLCDSPVGSADYAVTIAIPKQH